MKETTKTRKVINQKLLQKLAERGETLEEREERRAQRRAARIKDQFGYTAEENPFNDPNVAETFSWKKKDEKLLSKSEDKTATNISRRSKQEETFMEIQKVRKRRQEYEDHREEMERIKAEESKMKELENYDEWARKEEDFHLQQQRQRSAIRLVEGRETPVDVLAKNLLLFGLTEEEKRTRAAVKYQERYNALDELETLEAELEEPHLFLKDLKLLELEELHVEIETFRALENEAAATASGHPACSDDSVGLKENPVLQYWNALFLVTKDEIEYVRTGGDGGSHSSLVKEIQKMFEGQSLVNLHKMKLDVRSKLSICKTNGDTPFQKADENRIVDVNYWKCVLDQLVVHLAKIELSDMHSKMLVCQLEKLEKRKDELGRTSSMRGGNDDVVDPSIQMNGDSEDDGEGGNGDAIPKNTDPEFFKNLEEELGLTNEFDLGPASYAWQEKYRPRKPRYFNRIKTGYDWNKYNQTHYDHDSPPPKVVQGYKFNIFYPDLIDRTGTPEYFLEGTDSKEFCIIRFRAGPPYEDIAFKIINREWNRSRKRGFRCTFQRGVLSLYFNFASHWYRR